MLALRTHRTAPQARARLELTARTRAALPAVRASAMKAIATRLAALTGHASVVHHILPVRALAAHARRPKTTSAPLLC